MRWPKYIPSTPEQKEAIDHYIAVVEPPRVMVQNGVIRRYLRKLTVAQINEEADRMKGWHNKERPYAVRCHSRSKRLQPVCSDR